MKVSIENVVTLALLRREGKVAKEQGRTVLAGRHHRIQHVQPFWILSSRTSST